MHHLCDFHVFSEDVSHFEANTFNNHALGIVAANYVHYYSTHHEGCLGSFTKLHPKTLAVSFLRSENKKDEVQCVFQLMMQLIYNISSSKPLRIQIGMWHKELGMS